MSTYSEVRKVWYMALKQIYMVVSYQQSLTFKMFLDCSYLQSYLKSELLTSQQLEFLEIAWLTAIGAKMTWRLLWGPRAILFDLSCIYLMYI